MGLVPLPEGGGVDLDNGRLDESVGADKLVVGRVVRLVEESGQTKKRDIAKTLSTHNADDPDLLGDLLGSPSEVSGLKAESTVLD